MLTLLRALLVATVLSLNSPYALGQSHCDACRCSCQQASHASCCCQAKSHCCGHGECPSCCGLANRDNLFGNWWGIKPHLAEHGITVDATLTQSYQGVTQGAGEQRFRYGDKMDVFVNADTGELGLWEGGSLTSHAVDWQFGQSVIGDATGLAPVNTALLLPNLGEPAYALTSLQYTHQLTGGWAATFGRINVFDLWTGFFPNYGRGIDGFMNVSTLMPLNAIPSVPMITNAAGVLKVGERGAEAGFLVLESQHSPTTVGLDFPNGVTLLAVARKYTDFGGQPGSHTLLGTYATGDYTSFDTEGWIILPPGGVAPAEKAGTWSASYLGEQRLWGDPCNAARYTSLFGYIGFSEVETSPFEWTASLSVESFGPLATRPADRTGVAYFYNALNHDFQEAFTLVTPVNDVHGAEFYYNAEITPSFHLTADVQVIDPTIEAEDTAVILGARARLDF